MSTGGAGGDAWSAGCVVQELCTLSKAFASRHLTALLRIIVHNQRAPLRPSPYSEELLDVVEGLLLPDLDARLSASTALPRVRSLIAESESGKRILYKLPSSSQILRGIGDDRLPKLATSTTTPVASTDLLYAYDRPSPDWGAAVLGAVCTGGVPT